MSQSTSVATFDNGFNSLFEAHYYLQGYTDWNTLWEELQNIVSNI